MFTRPKILVCSDFSPSSDRALKVASDLAKKTSGELILLHVAEIGFYLNSTSRSVSPGEVDKNFKELVHVDLMEKLDEQKARCHSSAKTMVVIDSNASRGINNVIDESQIDLVVLGDKGASGLENFLLGSLARKTAAAVAIPALIVKSESTIQNIAALVNGYEEFKEVIKKVQGLSKSLGSRLSVVSLVPAFLLPYSGNVLEYSSAVINALEVESHKHASDVKNKIQESLGNDPTQIIVKTTNKDVAHGLAEVLQSENIDLAVIKKHHKSWLEKHILGSVSARFLELYRGNVLVI